MTRFPGSRLRFERLEDRLVPTQFGLPWPDPGHLTLSFAPDGTTTPAGPSTAGATMFSAANWQREVLRAFQTWAVNANIDIGVVADQGQPLGSVGAVQGDSRFGDVRVAAAAINSDSEVAFSSPFTWSGTTYSGDFLFDSNRAYRVGDLPNTYDVFTVAAHEAGHVFGLDHSTDPGSVLQETYAYRTGLAATDVAHIQGLYGARVDDQYDAARRNDTPATATPLPAVPGSSTQLAATADLTTPADVDYFSFTPAAGTLTSTIRLKASGLSLLTPEVTVRDSAGRTVAHGASTDPLNNDITLVIALPAAGRAYTVQVDGAQPGVFGVGGYQLVVDNLNALAPRLGVIPGLLATLDGLTNDTLQTATLLQPQTTTDSRFDATYRDSIEGPSDTDFYKVRTGKFPAGQAANLNVLAWGTGLTALNPVLHVFDAAGRPVAAQVLANAAGVYSVQLPNAVVGADYYIQVAGRDSSVLSGDYFLAVDFHRLPLTTFDGLAGGPLAAGATVADTLTVVQSGIYQLALAGGTVTTELVNDAGRVVVSLAANGGPAVTAVQYVPAGRYTVRYRNRSSTAAARYDLYMQRLTDPIGPRGTTTSSSGGTSGGSPPSGDYTYTGSSTTQPSGYPASY